MGNWSSTALRTMVGVPSKPRLDLTVLNAAMKSKFGSCVIDIGCNLNPLLPIGGGSVISLSFLDALREDTEDPFLPPNIYVRECMQDIFALFLRDITGPVERAGQIMPRLEPCTIRTILNGSPGIGKSVLFFLAALLHARNMITVYYRRTEMSDYISVFVMMPCPDKKIQVFFSNTLSKNEITDLTGLDASLRETIGIHREKYFAFVSGPRHDDSHNTLFKTYDYLCTSGRHPSFKSDEIGHWHSWTLDGWSKEEAALALSITGHKDQAAMAYWLCGGNIRDMMSCCTPQGFRATREDIDHVVKFIPTLQQQLVYWGTDRAKDSSDQWQTMCRGKLGYETIQFVDSEYVMTCLLKITDLVFFFVSKMTNVLRGYLL
jgi:hypothetical protein